MQKCTCKHDLYKFGQDKRTCAVTVSSCIIDAGHHDPTGMLCCAMRALWPARFSFYTIPLDQTSTSFVLWGPA